MKQSRIAVRYAKALLELSIEKNSIEQSYNDMFLISNICMKNKELSLLLKTPIINSDKKLNILKQIFENKIGEISMMFITIITNKKRESFLASIAKAFIGLYKIHKNIDSATVTTAIPLSDDLKSQVINFINRNNNKKVELKEIVDKNIIGGAIIRIGDKQLDASVSSEISELRKVFNQNLYIQDF